jgi:16S rRNA (cytidine1402-2'-O)-methyltransferase
MGNLFVVATPIGNLKDITIRALETLKSVDYILAEDTRVALKLLSYYNIKKPLISYHKYSADFIYQKIYSLLLENKNIALVSDAGTPLISDPGERLIKFLLEKNKNIKIIPIPGASALIAALSVAGANAGQFVFLGYPPHQKGRKKFFEKIINFSIWPVVLYESPHRLEKTLKNLMEVLGENFKIIICRELTKIYEEIWRGNISEALNYFKNKKVKGEFVLILEK